MSKPFSFQLLKTDGDARRGELITPHGKVQTPAFMPVGTQATVKGLMPDDVRATGAEIVLGNTYHLMLRPGAERIAALGGLHKFMNWPLPILTDSGGFQVMSLSELRQIDERGVTFRSHLDGAMVALSPERAVEIQALLGADISMQLDECLKLPASSEEIARAMQLSLRWAERSKRAFESRAKDGYALFGIVQGGDDLALRAESARALTGMDFQGYAIGGLAVGEPQEVMLKIVAETAPALPAQRPRYLMGVGTPHDLLEAVKRGIDMFDCVLPTRNGRHGGLHALRPDQSRQRTPRERSAAARRRERACGRAHLFARLSASPDQGQRNSGCGAALDRQSCLLPDFDGGHARRHRGRALCRISGRRRGRLDAGRFASALRVVSRVALR
jgi:queuine tRNA-ribosyltransferase